MKTILFIDPMNSKAYCASTPFEEALGGITTIIKDNVNGFALPSDDQVSRYCDVITRLLSNKSQYNELCLRAYNEYKMRLNWKTATQSVTDMIKGELP